MPASQTQHNIFTLDDHSLYKKFYKEGQNISRTSPPLLCFCPSAGGNGEVYEFLSFDAYRYSSATKVSKQKKEKIGLFAHQCDIVRQLYTRDVQKVLSLTYLGLTYLNER